jgi:hypothetical protein
MPEVGDKYLARNRVAPPDLGRWTRRDPEHYVDGVSLYAMLLSQPQQGLDPFGTLTLTQNPGGMPGGAAGWGWLPGVGAEPPPMRDGACCQAAYDAGVPQPGQGGGVICCNGRKVACNWVYLPNDGGPLDEAEKLIKKCNTAHEETHYDDQEECDSSGIYQPGWKAGADKNAEEAAGYTAGLECAKAIDCSDAQYPEYCEHVKQKMIDNFTGWKWFFENQ